MDMPREFDEKRDFVRVYVDCPVLYRHPGSREVAEGQAKNLSGRGMMFIAQQELPVDSEVEISISPENELTPSLNAVVKVVRVARYRKGEGYEIGAVIKQVLDEE